MLLLGRYVGQSIRIGDSIKLIVRRIGADGRVTLAIEAPREIGVHRAPTAQPPSTGRRRRVI